MDKPLVRDVPVHQVPLSDLYLASEAPQGSNLVVRNSSVGGGQSDAELRASLHFTGLIRPLLFKVVDKKFYVVSGNRRLRLLREIFIDENNPGEKVLIPCQNVADFTTDWRAIALEENLAVPPHAVERYEQIVKLADEIGLSPEEAQVRFGLTPRQYSQIMALGKMSPLIREKWRIGEIDYRAAAAFTLEPDHKEQERIFNAILKSGHHIGDWAVTNKIIPESQRAAGSMVEYLGVEFCREQGILKQEDMFATSHTVTDTKKLVRLVDERLTEKCEQLMSAGWSWAVLESTIPPGERYHYATMHPDRPRGATKAEKERMETLDEAGVEALEDEIKQRGYTADQKSKSGCILSIVAGGKLNVEYGRLRPADRRKVEASQRAAAKKADGAPEKGEAVQQGISNSLAQRLSEALQEAIGVAMGGSIHQSVAALIAACGSGGTLLDVQVKDAWDSEEKDFLQLFEGACNASAQAQLVMLTKIATQALSIVTHNASHEPLKKKPLQALVSRLPAAAVEKAISERFDKFEYFKSVPMAMIVAAVRCSLGDQAADHVATLKKSAAVEYASNEVKGWLPPELRTAHYKGPVEKDAKPSAPSKAKPVKKDAAKQAKKKDKK